MTRRHIVYSAFLVTSLGLISMAAGADDLKALQARMKDRFLKLQKLKDDGKIGETWSGYVEAVKDEFKEEAGNLVSDENDDRKKLYRIMADQEGITPEEVAKNNAVRIFQRAKKGEYLKGENGQWKQK